MRNSVRKSISMILAATMILVGVTDNNVFAAKQKTVEKSLEEYKEVLNYTAEYKEYSEYISQYEKAVSHCKRGTGKNDRQGARTTLLKKNIYFLAFSNILYYFCNTNKYK